MATKITMSTAAPVVPPRCGTEEVPPEARDIAELHLDEDVRLLDGASPLHVDRLAMAVEDGWLALPPAVSQGGLDVSVQPLLRDRHEDVGLVTAVRSEPAPRHFVPARIGVGLHRTEWDPEFRQHLDEFLPLMEAVALQDRDRMPMVMAGVHARDGSMPGLYARDTPSMPGLQLPNPPPTSEATRAVMKANRARDTRPERTLRGALREAGYPGYRLNWRLAPGRPDISYPGRRVAIFVHGCYWHHCLRCYPNVPKSNPDFWARKFELNRERDARKRRQLEDADWRVFEVWECDIRDRLDGVIAEITTTLAERT